MNIYKEPGFIGQGHSCVDTNLEGQGWPWYYYADGRGDPSGRGQCDGSGDGGGTYFSDGHGSVNDPTIREKYTKKIVGYGVGSAKYMY